jgi:PAS domain S-box-containing protein
MGLKLSTDFFSRKPYLKITVYFLLFGLLWILFSDKVLAILIPEIEKAYHFQTYKGWFFILMVTVLIYVTSRNHFKKILNLSEEISQHNVYIEKVFDNLPIGLTVNDQDNGKAVYMNRKFEEIYGWPLKGLDVDEFFNTVYKDPDYREKIKKLVMDGIKSGDPDQMTWENIHITTQTGHHRIITARNIPIEEQGLMVSLVSETTQSKKAERQLIESRNRYKAIFENSSVPMWEEDVSQAVNHIENLKNSGITDIELYLNENPTEIRYISALIRTVEVNKATLDLFKATDKNQLFEWVFNQDTADYQNLIKNEFIGFFRQLTGMEFNYSCKNLEENALHLKLSYVPAPGYEQKPNNFIVSVIDLTEIVLAQKKLEEEEQKANLAIDASGLGYWEADYKLGVNRINDQWARMLEYEKDEIEQTYEGFRKLVYPDDMKKLEVFINDNQDVINTDVRMKTKSNQWKWIRINGRILERDEYGKALKSIGTHRDISFDKEKEKELLRSFIEGKDKERKRIARDLHDSLGQSLTAANMSFDLLLNESDKLSSNAIDHLNTGLTHLKEAIGETRNISQNLLPRTVDDFGLIPGLKNFFSMIRKTAPLEIVFYENLGEMRLEQEIELHIYRIVQEAVNNSVKHSGCSQINIQLIIHDQTLIITIEDNGKGFNNDLIKDEINGFGLKNIEIRSKAIAGEYNIESSPEKGTIIIIEVDLM